jgi:hypothetical protein
MQDDLTERAGRTVAPRVLGGILIRRYREERRIRRGLAHVPGGRRRLRRGGVNVGLRNEVLDSARQQAQQREGYSQTRPGPRPQRLKNLTVQDRTPSASAAHTAPGECNAVAR